MAQTDPLGEFEEILSSIIGVVLDSSDAYQLLQATLENQAKVKSWDSPIYYGDGSTALATNVAHVTTIAERIARNADGGENAIFVSNMALVAIYSFWEDHFRAEIAAMKDVPKDALKSDVMGDIRRLRQAIIHNRGIATAEVGTCRVLNWFAQGDDIFLNEQMFLQLVSSIRMYLHELRSDLSGIHV